MKSIAKKAEAHFRNQSAPKPPTQKEGEISIDKMPSSKSSNNDVGEYVDYEEVE